VTVRDFVLGPEEIDASLDLLVLATRPSMSAGRAAVAFTR
jgi:hypothetical protein